MAGSNEHIGLIGCVKRKRTTPAPAQDLYTSALFRGRRRFVERTCARWLILSAAHGVLEPTKVVAPYDHTLKAVTAAQRREWASRVLNTLEGHLGTLHGRTFEIHAGAEYRDHGLVCGLIARGADVDVPTYRMPIGQQLAFYARTQGPTTAARSVSSPTGAGSSTPRRPGPASTPRSSGSAGRYAPLSAYLREQPRNELTLDFAEVERILGRPLPASARRHHPWWSNSTAGHNHARGWLNAGWRVAGADLAAGRVTFAKTVQWNNNHVDEPVAPHFLADMERLVERSSSACQARV